MKPLIPLADELDLNTAHLYSHRPFPFRGNPILLAPQPSSSAASASGTLEEEGHNNAEEITLSLTHPLVKSYLSHLDRARRARNAGHTHNEAEHTRMAESILQTITAQTYTSLLTNPPTQTGVFNTTHLYTLYAGMNADLTRLSWTVRSLIHHVDASLLSTFERVDALVSMPANPDPAKQKHEDEEISSLIQDLHTLHLTMAYWLSRWRTGSTSFETGKSVAEDLLRGFVVQEAKKACEEQRRAVMLFGVGLGRRWSVWMEGRMEWCGCSSRCSKGGEGEKEIEMEIWEDKTQYRFLVLREMDNMLTVAEGRWGVVWEVLKVKEGAM